MNAYYVYIVASNSGAIYIGMTNDLTRRVKEHKSEKVAEFTRKYKCKKLIYFEQCSDINSVILREKQLKKWNRAKKLALIKTINPKLIDLSTSSR